MKSIFIISLFLVSTSLSFAQKDAVELFYNKDHELAYYKHKVQPKETLYALSRTYGCDVEDILHINKMKSADLSLGQILIIPFKNELMQYHKPLSTSSNMREVFYQVKRKETAFRISRSYFQVNLTAIKELNHLKRNSLKIGQRLVIGYIRNHLEPSSVSAPVMEEVVQSIPKHNINVVQPPNLEVEVMNTKPLDNRIYSVNYENGAAFWNKDAAGLNGYFVLHRYAERNTWIEVTNPMYQNSVQAKVIGNIPDTGYPSDVLIVVSPAIAKDLGALDARFYVKVRYLRAESRLTKGK